MNQTWYVTFEVPKSATLVQRRNPRLTKTFDTEAKAREFARTKFHAGLIVTAGTLNPQLPRKAIPSVEIPACFNPTETVRERANNHDRLSSNPCCSRFCQNIPLVLFAFNVGVEAGRYRKVGDTKNVGEIIRGSGSHSDGDQHTDRAVANFQV